MNRSLDFTACDLPCEHPCWRRLTEEEKEWLETHPNRQAFTLTCIEKEKKKEIDRIDNNGNYCPENCRWVDASIQQRNKRIQKNNNSGYKGIYFSKTENKYCAQIGFNKKQITIGRFDNIKQAIEARNNYIIQNNLSEYKIQEWRE